MTTFFTPTQMDDGLVGFELNGTSVGYAWTTPSGSDKVTYFLVTQSTNLPTTGTMKITLENANPNFNNTADFETWVAAQPNGKNYTKKIKEVASYGTW